MISNSRSINNGKTAAMYSFSCFHLLTVAYLMLTSVTVFAEKTPEDILTNNWILAQSDNFVVISDVKESKVEKILQDLENFRKTVQSYLNFSPKVDVSPLTIIALDKSFSAIVDNRKIAGYSKDAMMQTYAIIDVSGYHPSNRNNKAREILYYFATNYIVENNISSEHLPLWFGTGFSNYFSTTQIKKDHALVGLPDPTSLRYIDFNVNYADIFTADKGPRKWKDSWNFSVHSWAVVHYFISDKSRRKQLTKLLNEIYAGVEINTAFNTAIKTTYGELRSKIQRYVEKGKFPYSKIVFDDFQQASQGHELALKSMSKSEVATNLAKVLFWYSQTEESQEKGISLLNSAIDLDPRNVDALLTIAYAYLEQKELDNAAKAIESAALIASETPEVNTVAGHWLLKKAKLEKASLNTNWQRTVKSSRNKFRKAILADDKIALAYLGLGDVYSMIPNDKDIREGISAYDNAYYFHQDPEILFNLAVLYSAQDNIDKSKSLLLRVIRDSEKEELSASATKLLTDLDLHRGTQSKDP